MSPSTSTPQNAFKHPSIGTYICHVCSVSDRGGQREFHSHWLREHYRSPEHVLVVEEVAP